jgi:DNA-binding transcriptional MerR regulator
VKVSELARKAGVSKETIHYYLREGLLPRPRMAGRNMAFYDDGHLERLLLIKRLRKERYLPLGVVERLLGDGPRLEAGPELELYGEVLALAAGDGAAAGADASAAHQARLCELTGFAPELAARIFALYHTHLAALAADEARLYARAIVASARPLEAAQGVRRARAFTNRYLLAERARLVQREIDAMLAELMDAAAGDGDPPLWPASPSLRTAGADDRYAGGGDDDLIALAGRLRVEVASAPARALPHALLGSALLRQAKSALRERGDDGALARLQEGLAELLASVGGETATSVEALVAQLVRGRTWAALPGFFGLRDRGLGELLRVADVGAAPGASATCVWMAANACYFLGLWERALELDRDGPLAARARGRLEEASKP